MVGLTNQQSLENKTPDLALHRANGQAFNDSAFACNSTEARAGGVVCIAYSLRLITQQQLVYLAIHPIKVTAVRALRRQRVQPNHRQT